MNEMFENYGMGYINAMYLNGLYRNQFDKSQGK
jgi:hypothetical protein